jgi:hypothetical protein
MTSCSLGERTKIKAMLAAERKVIFEARVKKSETNKKDRAIDFQNRGALHQGMRGCCVGRMSVLQARLSEEPFLFES